ncbi:unnamed protein product [Adineta ricciae]|uniref:Uncharacterized protein n=1 Tax=Adineta ricciae TaxID=249248 RepID=A0A816B0J5_ADIRI|nr:unnamed protein product [Adineta ricciae]CAF1602147.1 unnamed protein product [Adineta ricciae]
MNLSKHCCSAFAEPGEERQAFQAQGHQDYDNFLKYRAEELHLGGVLILAHCCVNEQGSTGCDQALHLVYKCAQSFLTSEELLEFNYSTYLNSYAECIDPDLLARHSFQLIKAGFARIASPLYAKYRDGKLTLDEFAHAKTEWIRSWSESSLEQALKTTGLRTNENTEQVLNQIWTRYEEEVREKPGEYDDCTICTYMALKKI